jgi:hypothetical protein
MASNEGSQPDVRIDFGVGSTTPFHHDFEPFVTFLRHPKRPAVSKYASRTLVQRPPGPSGGSFFGLRARPHREEARV